MPGCMEDAEHAGRNGSERLAKIVLFFDEDCITFVTATSQSTDGSLQPQMGTHINDW